MDIFLFFGIIPIEYVLKFKAPLVRIFVADKPFPTLEIKEYNIVSIDAQRGQVKGEGSGNGRIAQFLIGKIDPY